MGKSSGGNGHVMKKSNELDTLQRLFTDKGILRNYNYNKNETISSYAIG